jgi:hypothetical protein
LASADPQCVYGQGTHGASLGESCLVLRLRVTIIGSALRGEFARIFRGFLRWAATGSSSCLRAVVRERNVVLHYAAICGSAVSGARESRCLPAGAPAFLWNGGPNAHGWSFRASHVGARIDPPGLAGGDVCNAGSWTNDVVPGVISWLPTGGGWVGHSYPAPARRGDGPDDDLRRILHLGDPDGIGSGLDGYRTGVSPWGPPRPGRGTDSLRKQRTGPGAREGRDLGS